MKIKALSFLLGFLLTATNAFAMTGPGQSSLTPEKNSNQTPTRHESSFDPIDKMAEHLKTNHPFSKRDETAMKAIFATLDRVDINMHRRTGRYLLLRYRQDVLAPALIAYLRTGGRFDPRQAAAWALSRIVYNRLGDKGLLILLDSDNREVKRAAIEVIRARLGGLHGFTRAVIGWGAPAAYRKLDAVAKASLVRALLDSTSTDLGAISAGMVESLGYREEIVPLVSGYAGRWDDMTAAGRVYDSARQSAINKCALLLQSFQAQPD